ncbi:MAG: 2-C-methyl-D-erythritol 4-phosphate cytidylyltransferase [Ignavibacteriales bacterium]|nr:2-C-methyl-D-erythritol 4-phosphate cytidylyltransferase [Ignavibacteriales bacterium]
MFKGKNIGVLIPAAGKGKRMGGSQSKQFLELAGKPIIVHTIEKFQQCQEVDSIVLAVDPALRETVIEMTKHYQLDKVRAIADGGKERQDSVWNGLKEMNHLGTEIVLIHDAVRPFIDTEIILKSIDAAITDNAAIVAVRPKDTVKISHENNLIYSTPDRNSVWLAQTPQAFEFKLIKKAFEEAISSGFYGTDDAMLVERLNLPVKILEGSYNNIKITTPEDIEIAELILHSIHA